MSEAEQSSEGVFTVTPVPALEPGEVHAHLDAQGQLVVTMPDGREYPGVRVVPAFPITRPDRFFYLLDSEGHELGLIVEPRRLDRETRELVFAQADQTYFMPRITRIIRIEERMGTGISRWEVETDRGASTFDVVSRSESVWYMGRDRIVIRDAHGNRYLIENMSALDKRSRALADLYM